MVASPLPLTELGALTGRFYLDERYLLIAMRLYLDGSESFGDGDRWLTLAAMVASDSIWAEFQNRWDAMLRSRYPIAPFIHMTDLINSIDPFERAAGWTEGKKRQLVYDAGEVLRSIPGNQLCAVYCTVNLSARERLVAKGFDLGDPAAICVENCLAHAWKWHLNKHGLETVYLYFDRGERFRPAIYGQWLAHNRNLIKHRLWGFIGGMPEVDMRFTPPVQAADIVAWAISRAHSPRADDDVWATLARELVWTHDPKTREHRPGMLTTVGLVLTEELLRKHHLKFKSRGPR